MARHLEDDVDAESAGLLHYDRFTFFFGGIEQHSRLSSRARSCAGVRSLRWQIRWSRPQPGLRQWQKDDGPESVMLTVFAAISPAETV